MMKKKLAIILAIVLQVAGLTSCHTEKKSPEESFLKETEAVVRAAEKIETAMEIWEFRDIYEAYLTKAETMYGWGENGEQWIEESESLEDVTKNSKLRMTEEQFGRLTSLKERFLVAQLRYIELYENSDPSQTDEDDDMEPFESMTQPEQDEEEEDQEPDNDDEEDEW